ncbi:hypothetical protein Tco_1028601 [Tanacetum coccineum]|uniref:Reverse transcriptase n=1 Tax=Tanacetum coccineum TaxID=301880 RepID=A0ABQ5G2G1_9ASTR
MWLRDSTLGEIVEDAWLDGVRKGLGSNPSALVDGFLQNQTRYDSYQQEHDLQNELKELYAREEVMWRQRSRVQWLFATSNPPECEEEISCLDKSLCDDDIANIGKVVSEDEVYDAVMQMHPSKAPGPDGMTALFY